MQIKLFTIPITDDGAFEQEFNAFLRAHKVLEVQQHLVNNENGASWCFCIRYVDSQYRATRIKTGKIDYREVLDEATFKIFAQLREIRKQIASEEGIPAFAVFTDEELAGISKLSNITPNTMKSVKGIGEKKVERYAARFIKDLNSKAE